jgi:murein DD-endopeptidase MepM/ murein hydrolase activator NlpD
MLGNYLYRMLFFATVCLTLGAAQATSLAASQPACGLQISARIVQGQLVQGRLNTPGTVSLNGQVLKHTAQGAFVFGVGRDADTLALQVHSKNGDCTYQLNILKRTWNSEVVNGVPQNTVTPSAAEQKRIAQEGALITAARALDSDLLDWQAPLQWPAAGRITGVYGSQRIVNKVPLSPHMGLDIAAPTGTPVYAPLAGTVSLVHKDMLMTGGTLIVDHGFGVSTVYIHLSKILARAGQRVRAGERIALIGSTGRASGPHLHFQVQWFQLKLDPKLLMPTAAPPALAK